MQFKEKYLKKVIILIYFQSKMKNYMKMEVILIMLNVVIKKNQVILVIMVEEFLIMKFLIRGNLKKKIREIFKKMIILIIIKV